ncbi:MAG: hypothetical protein HYZ40_00570 [Rhodospirillales bacterium]|nr:hypothetical protein [Rhodospirillales bacterium]
MLDHLSITTTDLDRAQTFYDAVLGALGHRRVNRRERSIGYGERPRLDGAPCYISIYLSADEIGIDLIKKILFFS